MKNFHKTWVKSNNHPENVGKSSRYELGKDQEATMFGYGIVGTILVICLIVWIARRM